MPDPVEGGACNEDGWSAAPTEPVGLEPFPDVAALGQAVACYAEGS